VEWYAAADMSVNTGGGLVVVAFPVNTPFLFLLVAIFSNVLY
jgi:hypothetical protein